MSATTLESMTELVELSEQLWAGRDTMLEPQDLPGRFGRAVKGVDHVLTAIRCESVLAGGWAVWRHGFTGRITKDLDIALPADRSEEFVRVSAVAGFEVLPQPPGRWPKVRHKESGVKVDILPERERPGTAARLAPTTIPHPARMGAEGTVLRYVTLPALVELKLAAGRPVDEADVIELIRANPGALDSIRAHLASVHGDYVADFERLVEIAPDAGER